MIAWLKKFASSKPATFKPVDAQNRIIFTNGSLAALVENLTQSKQMQHEGIVYLIGQTDGKTTLVASTMKPEAKTTMGSFHVTANAMAKVVRAACDAGLGVVGQVHTHPGAAFHSDGDVEGAKIVYPGYVSIVIPQYGRFLPSMKDSAVYFYHSHGEGFKEMDLKDVTIVAEKL